jgi:hypothetical protein
MLVAVTALNFITPVHDIVYQALIVMAASTLGIFLPDLLWQKVQKRAVVSPAAGNWPRSLIKLVGLLGSLGFITLLYWLLPEYALKGFYAHYWAALRVLLPLWASLALPYLYWIDRRLREPHDALWQMGRLLTLQWHDVSTAQIGQHLLGWLVKGFYLPLMFTYFCADLDKLLHYDLTLLHGFSGYYDWAYFTLYFIDVALVSMTYLMSLKLTDTHIRSTEPTALGWLAALVCYEPFWSLIGRQYLAYDSGPGWGVWLRGIPWLYGLWGSLILLLVFIYVWSTVAFGARFSNLTHRGIITNGPYRHTKHSAYLAKNVSWWLIAMPFMSSGNSAQILRSCCLLALLNAVHYLRAKTEERHLSLDPVSEQYAQWIERHGALRFLNRIPILASEAHWRPRWDGRP